jgi:hypothetical protein
VAIVVASRRARAVIVVVALVAPDVVLIMAVAIEVVTLSVVVVRLLAGDTADGACSVLTQYSLSLLIGGTRVRGWVVRRTQEEFSW